MKKLKIGDRVKTKTLGDTGNIVKESSNPQWDWFVDIEFRVGTRLEKMREPYLESELILINGSTA